MRILEIWYNRLDEASIRDSFPDDREIVKRLDAVTPAAKMRIHEHVFPKLSEVLNGKRVIKDEPPLIYHVRDTEEQIRDAHEFFINYRDTLGDHMKSLLDRYQLMDVAMKVVGVGSVGTRCLIGLFMGEQDDALFLQFKEARASVLEAYANKSVYSNHGERIVNGQRLLQTVSDIFLGWTTGPDAREFYVRHLKDMKGSANLESQDFNIFNNYVMICAWALAKSHAKSGGAPEISGYIGKSDELPEAISDFGFLYAEQTEKDYEALKIAERGGLITRSEDIL
jgi:hypothetical protein